ncbi:hypothetical protein Tco_0216742, partial [Tanacetum coccineum]
APLRLHWICSPEYPQKGTFALPNQTVVAATIEVGTDVGSPNVRTSRGGGGGDNAIPPEIHVWIERFTKLKPLAFRSAVTPASYQSKMRSRRERRGLQFGVDWFSPRPLPFLSYEKLGEKEIRPPGVQWHAQQIAIGKATDNTNFQPIGVDWQKIIRRKRAEKSVETEQSVAKSYLLKFWDVEVAEIRYHVSKDQHQAHVGSLANVDHLTFVAQAHVARSLQSKPEWIKESVQCGHGESLFFRVMLAL